MRREKEKKREGDCWRRKIISNENSEMFKGHKKQGFFGLKVNVVRFIFTLDKFSCIKGTSLKISLSRMTTKE